MSDTRPLRSSLGWFPGVLLSLAAVYFLSRFINPDELIKAFKTLTIADLGIMLVLLLLSLCARANGWRHLLEEVPFKQAFLVVNEGYLFNNLIPRSGEIVRTLLISGTARISAFQVASSVLVERALDVLIAASMFLITLPFAIELTWIKPIAWVLFSICIVLLFVLVILAIKSERVKIWMDSLHFKSTLLRTRIIPKIGLILDGLAVLKQPLKFGRALFWILISWTCWTSLVYFGMTRLSAFVPIWWAIFAQGVLALGIALPSAPAGVGVYEGTMVAAFSVFGFSESGALSIALTLHVMQIVVTTIIGIYGLMVQGQSMTALVQRIRLRKPEQT